MSALTGRTELMLNTGSEGMICAGSRRRTSQYHASEQKSSPAAAGALWVQGSLARKASWR